MKTPRHILAKAIASRTIDLRDEKLLAREIAAYLLLERRTSELESILRDIMQYRSDHGVLEAEIVTAHNPGAHVAVEVKRLLKSAYPSAKTIHLANRQDPALIGGLRVDMANQQLDLSIQAKLATFKRLTSEEIAK